MRQRVAVDIGGTFTDAVAIGADGTERTAKALSTPDDLAVGVLDAVRGLGLDLSEVEVFVHGTTAGLNAVLERRGARVALVTTKGFRDVYEIGRANRPAMYDVRYRPPQPFARRRDVYEVDERMTADGLVLTPIEPAEIRALAAELAGRYDAVAICLLHAYANAAHEREIVRLLAEEAPTLTVVASSAVAPEWREFERTSTTVMSAYVAPIVDRYLGRLESALAAQGIGAPLRVMQSNGGIMTARTARARPVQTLLSGPVGGTVAGVTVAAELGLDRLICIDMGGTSFDVSLVVDGAGDVEQTSSLEGHPLLTPAVAIHTIGAGGGSIAYLEAGALRVGPRSAGASPGPACYRRGGIEPTVTDANVLLGRLPGQARLGGSMELDVDAAAAAIDAVGAPLGLDPLAAALGIVAVADAAMANAIREITVSRGIDPRDFGLLAFGGAGPLHAVSLAEELSIPRVVVPAQPGVLSAWGMLHTDTRHDLVQSFFVSHDALTVELLETALEPLREQARRLLDDEGIDPAEIELAPALDVRYVGQEYAVTVGWQPDEEAASVISSLAARFSQAHLDRYGHNNPGESIECVNLRLTARAHGGGGSRPAVRAGSGDGDSSTRSFLAGAWHDTAVLRRQGLAPGTTVVGPAIVLEDACTTPIPPGWSGSVSPRGHLVLERS